jgi:hypothetical protein
MAFEDAPWKTMLGGYRIAYDPRPALQHLSERPSEQDWSELWNELHHQGDVDVASYASVPLLVEIHHKTRSLGWNFYAICATIETERHRKTNPPLPQWLQKEYERAWTLLPKLALDDLNTTSDPLLVRSAIAVLAIGKGLRTLGALVLNLDDSELQELLEQKFNWSKLYEAG